MKSRRMHVVLLISIFFFVFVSATAAQEAKPPQNSPAVVAEGPSLQETIEFIHGMIGENRPSSMPSLTTRTEIKDGCNMQVTNTIPGPSIVYTQIWTGNLSKLDPVSASAVDGASLGDATAWYLFLPSTGGKKVIHFIQKQAWTPEYARRYETFQNSDKKQREQLLRQDGGALLETPPQQPNDQFVDRFSFVLEREQAKRLAKAFKHAITLCGGKVSPF